MMYEVVDRCLYYQNKYFFYDENFNSMYPVDPRMYGIFYADGGAWIETKDETGRITSKHLSFSDWKIDTLKDHRYSSDSVTIDRKLFNVEGKRKETKIASYLNEKEIKSINIPGLELALKIHGDFLYAYTNQTVYCLDVDLNIIWTAGLVDEILSVYVEFDGSEEKNSVLLVYSGSDSTSYEFRAYAPNTGELMWRHQDSTKATSIQCNIGELYICVNGVFIKLNLLTGNVDANQPLFFERDDGNQVPIISVFPIKNGILCFYEDENFIEIRTEDAIDILQKIILPESSYIFPSDPNVLEHSGKYYIGLGHQVLGLNPMKSAVAILSPDNTASEDHQAFFESRPPYTVAPIKDKLGKNAYLVKMEGDDGNKIIRYACVVLKELAFKSGVTRFFEFETRDKNNAGLLSLEINTSQLQASGFAKNWSEVFAVIKERTELELKDSHVLAGDGESYFQVELKVV